MVELPHVNYDDPGASVFEISCGKQTYKTPLKLYPAPTVGVVK